jgi:hypothetical protein
MHCPHCRRAASFALLRKPHGSFYRCGACQRSSRLTASRLRYVLGLAAIGVAMAGIGLAYPQFRISAGAAGCVLWWTLCPWMARRLEAVKAVNPILAAAYNPKQYRRMRDE